MFDQQKSLPVTVRSLEYHQWQAPNLEFQSGDHGLIKIADWKMDNEWRCVEHAFPTLKWTFSDCNHVRLLQSKSVPMYLRRIRGIIRRSKEQSRFGSKFTYHISSLVVSTHLKKIQVPVLVKFKKSSPSKQWLQNKSHDYKYNGSWWTHGSDLNIIYSYRPRRDKNRDHPVEPTQLCCWDQLETTNDVGPISYRLVVEPTHLKNMRQSNWIISPGRVENKKYLKPPPSILVSEDKFLAIMFSLHESEKSISALQWSSYRWH